MPSELLHVREAFECAQLRFEQETRRRRLAVQEAASSGKHARFHSKCPMCDRGWLPAMDIPCVRCDGTGYYLRCQGSVEVTAPDTQGIVRHECTHPRGHVRDGVEHFDVRSGHTWGGAKRAPGAGDAAAFVVAASMLRPKMLQSD